MDEPIARWAGHSVGTDVGRESVPAAKIDLSKMSDVACWLFSSIGFTD